MNTDEVKEQTEVISAVDFTTAYFHGLKNAAAVYLEQFINGKFNNPEKELAGINLLEEVARISLRKSSLSCTRRSYVLYKYCYLQFRNCPNPIPIFPIDTPLEDITTDGGLNNLVGSEGILYNPSEWEDFDINKLPTRPCQVVSKFGAYHSGWYWPDGSGIGGCAYCDIRAIRSLDLVPSE